jgi:hypothetical protein
MPGGTECEKRAAGGVRRRTRRLQEGGGGRRVRFMAGLRRIGPHQHGAGRSLGTSSSVMASKDGLPMPISRFG